MFIVSLWALLSILQAVRCQNNLVSHSLHWLHLCLLILNRPRVQCWSLGVTRNPSSFVSSDRGDPSKLFRSFATASSVLFWLSVSHTVCVCVYMYSWGGCVLADQSKSMSSVGQMWVSSCCCYFSRLKSLVLLKNSRSWPILRVFYLAKALDWLFAITLNSFPTLGWVMSNDCRICIVMLCGKSRLIFFPHLAIHQVKFLAQMSGSDSTSRRAVYNHR